MIEHDAERLSDLGRLVVAFPREFFQLRPGRGEQVGVVHAPDAVQDADRAVQPHAGIHVLLFQRLVFALRVLEILHKYVVPDLDVFAAVAGGGAVLRAFFVAAVDEHLGVRTAGAGEPGGTPPVILAGQEEDFIPGDAAFLPDARALLVARGGFVAGKHADGELFDGDSQAVRARQKLEAPADGVLLEVVSQAPVPQHFKKGQVGIVSHFVDVARAHAFLHVRQAGALGVLLSQKIGDEGVHSRRRKEHGRVVFGDQRGGGDDMVPLALVKFQKFLSQFFTGQSIHGLPLLIFQCIAVLAVLDRIAGCGDFVSQFVRFRPVFLPARGEPLFGEGDDFGGNRFLRPPGFAAF